MGAHHSQCVLDFSRYTKPCDSSSNNFIHSINTHQYPTQTGFLGPHDPVRKKHSTKRSFIFTYSHGPINNVIHLLPYPFIQGTRTTWTRLTWYQQNALVVGDSDDNPIVDDNNMEFSPFIFCVSGNEIISRKTGYCAQQSWCNQGWFRTRSRWSQLTILSPTQKMAESWIKCRSPESNKTMKFCAW